MFRLIVFTTTFFLGMASGAILDKLETAASWAISNVYRQTGVAEADPTVLDDQINITFAGWTHHKDGSYPTLRFVVHNGTGGRLYFRGYSADDPWPLIRMGETKIWYYWCGTGVGRHSIPSGKSLTFYIPGHVFRDHLNRKARFTVGLDLSPVEEYDAKPRLIETEPFALPDDLIKELTSVKD